MSHWKTGTESLKGKALSAAFLPSAELCSPASRSYTQTSARFIQSTNLWWATSLWHRGCAEHRDGEAKKTALALLGEGKDKQVIATQRFWVLSVEVVTVGRGAGQQRGYLQGSLWKCQFAGPAPNLLIQKLGVSLAICGLTSPLGDSDVGYSVRESRS